MENKLNCDWDVDCSVRINDVLDVRTIKRTDRWYQKCLSSFVFKFDNTGVEIWCGTQSKKIEAVDMTRFLVKRLYEIQMDGIVLDYFLTTFEDSYPIDETSTQYFRFLYCAESGKSVFKYEVIEK